MSTTPEYIEYVCEQISGVGPVRYKKMFGEYMVYVHDKPVFLVCDNTVFVKKLDCVSKLIGDAQTGYPYSGAKEHYILNIDDRECSMAVVTAVEKEIPIPKKRK